MIRKPEERKNVLVYVVEHHKEANVFFLVEFTASEPSGTFTLGSLVVGIVSGSFEKVGDGRGQIEGGRHRWGEDR